MDRVCDQYRTETFDRLDIDGNWVDMRWTLVDMGWTCGGHWRTWGGHAVDIGRHAETFRESALGMEGCTYTADAQESR